MTSKIDKEIIENSLNEYLKDSPYSEEQQEELTVRIEGLIEGDETTRKLIKLIKQHQDLADKYKAELLELDEVSIRKNEEITLNVSIEDIMIFLMMKKLK